MCAFSAQAHSCNVNDRVELYIHIYIFITLSVCICAACVFVYMYTGLHRIDEWCRVLLRGSKCDRIQIRLCGLVVLCIGTYKVYVYVYMYIIYMYIFMSTTSVSRVVWLEVVYGGMSRMNRVRYPAMLNLYNCNTIHNHARSMRN